VGILGWIEAREQLPHLMAPKALALSRPQRAPGRVERDKLSLGRELVA
jgi:hypothetical protein